MNSALERYYEAKRREEKIVAYMEEIYHQALDSLEMQEEENDQLKSLIYDMWKWMSRARYETVIRRDEMDRLGERAVALGLHDYELGIEVDE